MLKQVSLFKRRPGMTMEEFVHYYENHHSKLGESVLSSARRYVRRYVTPRVSPMSGEASDVGFDCIMEIWWDSQADLDAAMAAIDEGTRRLILADEERLFDSHNNRTFFVEEFDSDIPNRVTT